MKSALACLCAWLCLSVGCARPPFTTGVIERFGLSRRDLTRVQFYLSEAIVLQRESTRQRRIVAGDELRLQDDTQTEEIHLGKHTPCVVLRAEGDYLLLGFSPGEPQAALWFAAAERAVTNEAGRRYELASLDNGYEHADTPFVPRWSKGFLITWSGQKYHVASGRSAYLLYELDDDFERHTIEQSPPGWRITDRVPMGPKQPRTHKAAADVPIEGRTTAHVRD